MKKFSKIIIIAICFVLIVPIVSILRNPDKSKILKNDEIDTFYLETDNIKNEDMQDLISYLKSISINEFNDEDDSEYKSQDDFSYSEGNMEGAIKGVEYEALKHEIEIKSETAGYCKKDKGIYFVFTFDVDREKENYKLNFEKNSLENLYDKIQEYTESKGLKKKIGVAVIDKNNKVLYLNFNDKEKINNFT